jgi:hypothetical protein
MNSEAKGMPPPKGSAAQKIWSQHAYRILVGAAAALILTGTVVYRLLEDWSWVDSFYFSVVAVSTVGFGDISPTTDVSKLFTVGYIIVGVGIITTYLNERFKYKAYERSH